MGYINRDELSQELLDYLNGLGLTEEQVNGLIANNLVNVQNFKLTRDNGYNKLITEGSFDSIITPGFYTIGSEVTGGPFTGYGGWYHLEVVADSELWVKQTVTIFEATGYGTKMYIRGMQNGTWAPWRELVDQAALDSVYEHVGYTQGLIKNGQTYKLTDDSGFCQNLGSVDWNKVKKTGYYMGSSTINAPENSSDWFMVHVMAHNEIWCEQIATAFSSTLKRYIRYQLNGTWQAWRSL